MICAALAEAQSSEDATVWPAAFFSSIVGWASAPGTAPASDGPRARITTFFAPVPWTTKPPIITLSPVRTGPRVERLMRVAGAAGSRSYTSAMATPAPPSAPRPIAV